MAIHIAGRAFAKVRAAAINIGQFSPRAIEVAAQIVPFAAGIATLQRPVVPMARPNAGAIRRPVPPPYAQPLVVATFHVATSESQKASRLAAALVPPLAGEAHKGPPKSGAALHAASPQTCPA